MRHFASPINKADLIDRLTDMVQSNGSNTPKKTVQNVVDSLGELACSELQNGREFTIPGIARLVVTTRAAREGRNPATGETIHIAEKQVVKAKLNKRLVECV